MTTTAKKAANHLRVVGMTDDARAALDEIRQFDAEIKRLQRRIDNLRTSRKAAIERWAAGTAIAFDADARSD